MEEYLNKGIKEVIDEFPGVGKILDEYDIGCGPCAVGTCLLKDVVEIHNLSEENEKEMMGMISVAIDPEKKGEPLPTKARAKAESKPKEITYSPPMKKLVDEHVLIKRLVAMIPDVVKILDVETEEGRQLILNAVDFIRSYADKFHHAKEEEILFKYFDETLEILNVMHEDHETARAHVRAIVEAIESRDGEAIVAHLSEYGALLSEHIKKEDEILYPWMDKNLSVKQIGELFSRFTEAEQGIGNSVEKYEAFIDTLEAKIQSQEG